MKIILPLNNEKPNENINLTHIFPLDTNNLNDELKDGFYCEIGKQLFIAQNKKFINEDYIGIIQNKRYFCFLDKKYKEYDYKEIFKDKDLLCTPPLNIGESMYELEFKGGIYDRIIRYIKNNNLIDKNKNFINFIEENIYKMLDSLFTENELRYVKSTNIGSFHNMFIAKTEFFYDYSNYLYEKLNKFKNSIFYKKIKENKDIPEYNKKQGAWFSETLLNTYIFNKKINVGYLNAYL